MPRGFSLDLSAFVLIALAVITAAAAYWKDPSLPILGAKNGLRMLWFVLPRLAPALILAGMLQVLIPQETVARYFGNQSGFGAIAMAAMAGILTPGGPMVSVPLLVVLANSGMALGPLVAYMTSWSLFGVQRIIAWEAPLMGWPFVVVRTFPALAFPFTGGWLVKVCYHEWGGGFRRSPRFRRAPRQARAAHARAGPRLSRPRNRGDHRPGFQGPRRGEPCPPLRARGGLRHARPHQCLRLFRSHGRRPRRGTARRSGRSSGQAPRPAPARLLPRPPAQAGRPLRRGQGGPPTRTLRSLPGGSGDGASEPRHPARAPVLARRRGPLHHPAHGLHPRSRDGRAQRGHVPAAGLRRP